MSIDAVRAANPGLAIKSINDRCLLSYGKILDSTLFKSLTALADRITDIDLSGNRYVASLPELEAEHSIRYLSLVFGFIPLEVGYCNGINSRLNGLEYHKSPEVDIAVTDLLLLLGRKSDIGPGAMYESKNLECFFIPAGTVLALNPEVLHFCPCRAEACGYKNIIALPRGTNEVLSGEDLAFALSVVDLGREGMKETSSIEARLLFMKNKWLLAHPDRTILVERGAFPGIRGENIEIAPSR